MDISHLPVMLDEVIQALAIKPSGIYVDATFGRGGHSAAILSQLNADGCLVVIDRDDAAIEHAHQLYGEDSRVIIIKSAFSGLKKVIAQHIGDKQVDGILFDFGVSSPQLDQAERGFSFSKPGPLDMRMDQSMTQDAASWLNNAEERDISYILKIYGEERKARFIARAIVKKREIEPLVTTTDLVRAVQEVIPYKKPGEKHPATRTFQAVRIFINEELEEIKSVLPQALESLNKQGRLVIMSFHSLEDRLVKQYFKIQADSDPYPSKLPIRHDQIESKATIRLVSKAQKASQAEIDINPRSRSAVLRVAESIHGANQKEPSCID